MKGGQMTPELQQQINDMIATIVGAIAAGLLPALVVLIRLAWKLVRAWADAKIVAIKNQEVRDALVFSMERLDATAETVVKEIEQTIAKRGDDGKIIDPNKLATVAIMRTRVRLPKIAEETLSKNYSLDDLNRLIKGKIESKVKSATCK